MYPQKPKCLSCPFAAKCIAFNQKKTNVLPVKKGKVKIRERYFNYLVIQDQKFKTLLEKRKGKGIWQNLFQFPLVETSKAIKNKKALFSEIPSQILEGLSTEELTLWNKEAIIHKLSHQKLNVYFWILPQKKELKNGLTIKKLKKQAVPVVIQNFIEIFFQFDS
jgi:A/G-specific adenine glycosylase